MSGVQTSYVGMTHQEIWDQWFARHGGEYRVEVDALAIHRKWKSLGKKIAHGPAVRLESRGKK